MKRSLILLGLILLSGLVFFSYQISASPKAQEIIASAQHPRRALKTLSLKLNRLSASPKDNPSIVHQNPDLKSNQTPLNQPADSEPVAKSSQPPLNQPADSEPVAKSNQPPLNQPADSKPDAKSNQTSPSQTSPSSANLITKSAISLPLPMQPYLAPLINLGTGQVLKKFLAGPAGKTAVSKGKMWPIAPIHQQHPIHGTFWDPREGYHFGIDIAVDDAHPEPGVPAGDSHRVYALSAGIMDSHNSSKSCNERRSTVGRFEYWHLDPALKGGAKVHKGDVIGYTCLGEWHIHLSEFIRFDNKIYFINPLRPSGSLGPQTDTAKPIVSEIDFYRPFYTQFVYDRHLPRIPQVGQRLSFQNLNGAVDVRFSAIDQPSYLGFLAGMPYAQAGLHPYAASFRLENLDTHDVIQRLIWKADTLPKDMPYAWHYAPGTSRYLSTGACVAYHKTIDPVCPGQFWFHAFANVQGYSLDTTKLVNGRYLITIIVADLSGNQASRAAYFTVLN